MHPLRIGTRVSRLALWQANHVADRLRGVAADRGVELVEIQTSGDQVRDVPLAQIGGEEVFTKEIQRALTAEQIDVAVHSLKDLPTIAVEGLLQARRHPAIRAQATGAEEVSSAWHRGALPIRPAE